MRPLMTLMLMFASMAFFTMDTQAQVNTPPTIEKAEATALRAYMIKHIDGRWLRRTIPGQINLWAFDRGSASIWVNKQEAYRVWISLGFFRDRAVIQTFMLVPIEEE